MFRSTFLLVVLIKCAHSVASYWYPHPMLDGKINGGVSVDIARHSYQCSMMYAGLHFCSCAIISEKYVITPAHCIHDNNPHRLIVRVGSKYLTVGGREYLGEVIRKHPNYNRRQLDNDIAVLELRERIEFNENVTGVELPKVGEEPGEGEAVICTGWSHYLGTQPLQAVTFTIINREKCREIYGDGAITDRMICARAKDACQGDTGSSLIYPNTKKLIGIASYGYGCSDKGEAVTVFANIANLQDFILNVTHIQGN